MERYYKRRINSSNGSLLLTGEAESSFLLQKKKITRDHRRECYSLIERIFGDGPSLDGDLIVINFFALVLKTVIQIDFLVMLVIDL
jgi:hypothetical protein